MGGRTQRSGWRRTLAALAIAASMAMLPRAAAAAEFFTDEIRLTVATSAARIWLFLDDFCSLAVQQGQASRCIVGAGGLGSIRELADGTQEVLVARGPFSFAYEMIAGPLAAAHFHAAMRVESHDPLRSEIVTTIIWDEAAVPPAEREAFRGRYRAVVEGMMQDAKVVAEGS